jgi:hypothetical protein
MGEMMETYAVITMMGGVLMGMGITLGLLALAVYLWGM